MKIPAGLLDKNFEYFCKDGEVYGIYGGHVYEFNQVPRQIEDVFFAEFILDIEFIQQHDSVMTRDVFKKWIALNFGLLNDVPDLEVETGKTNKESSHLPQLTNKETEVLKAIIHNPEKPYKQISSIVHVAKNTFNQHAKSIHRKFGVHSKTELVMTINSMIL